MPRDGRTNSRRAEARSGPRPIGDRSTHDEPITDLTGHALSDAAGMDERSRDRQRRAARSCIDALAARIPCNVHVGRDGNLWDMVFAVAWRILPFCPDMIAFEDECHRLRSFLAQASTRPAYRVVGTSRMGDVDIRYESMPGGMEVTMRSGDDSAGFEMVVDDGGMLI